MNNDKIRINKSHIAVLRKSSTDSSLEIEYVKIDKPVVEKTDSLFELLKQDNIPDDKLISLLKSNLPELKSKESLKYCVSISDSYQGIYLENEIINRIENLEDTIGKFRKIILVNEVGKFLKNKKEGKTFDQSLRKVKGKHIMYSHRYYGWHCQPYSEIDSNFKVRIESNFGYGWVSYFLTVLTFKGVDIVPFSHFVEYKNAKVHEIIRYSKKHWLLDEKWEECFNYVIEATSDYNNSPELFIEKYIINECEKLVEGLDWIATKSRFTFKEDKVIRDKRDSSKIKFETKSIQKIYTGRLRNFIRAEKITGALSFINSINKCEELFDTSSIVKRIEKINYQIQPMLQSEKSEIKREIKATTKKHDRFVKKLDEAKKRIEPKFEEYNRLKNNNQKLEIVDFLNRYPNFGKAETDYNELKKSVFTAASCIRQLEMEKEQIKGFIKNQKDYFNK